MTNNRSIRHLTALLALALSIFAGSSLAAAYVSPETIPGTTYVDAAQAHAMFERGVMFVDVRIASDYEVGRIPGAINLTIQKNEAESPFTEASLLKLLGGKDVEAVFYCNSTSCWRTAAAAERAMKWGFTKIHYYRLGFPDWKATGYPVE
jgi:rhodanese-related sulfurtransferase